MKEIILKIKEKWQMIISVTFIIAAIFFSITAFIPPKYSSEVSLIVIQKQANYNVDAFSAAKSAEYLSDVLSRIIYTEAFFKDVMDAPYEVNTEFSNSSEKRKDEWKKMVNIRKINNTGILNVVVFNPSRDEAEKIAKSIVWSYEIRGHKYHGGGGRVKIELIDGPITSEKPDSPDLILNTLLGLIVGLIGSIALAYFVDDFDLKIFKKVEDKKNKKEEKNSLNKKKQDISNKLKELKDKFQIKKEESSFRVLNDEEIKEIKEDVVSELPVIKKEVEFNGNVEKKAEVPQNLPYLDYEPKKSAENGFIDVAELDKENLDKQAENNDNDEPGESEVKERLNKLLNGDL